MPRPAAPGPIINGTPEGLKVCTKCKEALPISSFGVHPKLRDGLYPSCKPCKATQSADYRRRNPTKNAENWKRWYAENSAKHLAKNAAYVQTPQGRAMLAASRAKRRGRMKVVNSDITASWLEELRVSTTCCSLCGIEFSDGHSLASSYPNLDHIIPLNIGGLHVMSNVRYICRHCNLSRPKDGRDL